MMGRPQGADIKEEMEEPKTYIFPRIGASLFKYGSLMAGVYKITDGIKDLDDLVTLASATGIYVCADMIENIYENLLNIQNFEILKKSLESSVKGASE